MYISANTDWQSRPGYTQIKKSSIMKIATQPPSDESDQAELPGSVGALGWLPLFNTYNPAKSFSQVLSTQV